MCTRFHFRTYLTLQAMRLPEKSASDHSNNSVMKRKVLSNPMKLNPARPQKKEK